MDFTHGFLRFAQLNYMSAHYKPYGMENISLNSKDNAITRNCVALKTNCHLHLSQLRI